jgi:small-conductance mechanosensitive channel
MRAKLKAGAASTLGAVKRNMTPQKQVKLKLVHIDFWSAVRVALLVTIASGIATIVGFVLLWAVVSQTGLFAIAGGLSVGLGFGVKEVFSNFISGLWLLFEGSVRPGEVLIIDGEACEVRRLGLRAAVLWRRSDNAELLIPNQTFFTSTTATYTGSDRMRRGVLMASVASSISPAEVIARLEEVARVQAGVLAEPAARATVEQFGNATSSYKLTYWMADPLTIREISNDLKLALWSNFKAEEISLS